MEVLFITWSQDRKELLDLFISWTDNFLYRQHEQTRSDEQTEVENYQNIWSLINHNNYHWKILEISFDMRTLQRKNSALVLNSGQNARFVKRFLHKIPIFLERTVFFPKILFVVGYRK